MSRNKLEKWGKQRKRRRDGACARSVNTLSYAWQKPADLSPLDEFLSGQAEGKAVETEGKVVPSPVVEEDAKVSTPLAFVLDIGCGDGSFPVSLGRAITENRDDVCWNRIGISPATHSVRVVGLEIQPDVVRVAERQIDDAGLARFVMVIRSNIKVDLDLVLERLGNAGSIKCVCVQFPDPHYHRKHAKRRILQTETVNTLAARLAIGCWVQVQSDVTALALEMATLLRGNPAFDEVLSFCDATSEDSSLAPLTAETVAALDAEEGVGMSLWGNDVISEREAYVRRSGKPVFRAIFRHNGYNGGGDVRGVNISATA